MILVSLPPADQLLRDLKARDAAIATYRAGAAAIRAVARDVEAGCDDRPCAEAGDLRRLAAHADAAAWLEEHNPGRHK